VSALQPPTESSFTTDRGHTPSFECVVSGGHRNAVWIRLGGELDLANSRQLTQTLRQAVAGHRLTVVDLRDLTSIDSTGLQAIIDADNRARRHGAKLVLIRGPAQVDQLFEVTGLADTLEIVSLPGA
jgi:anti-anti-sigma factor